MQEDMICDVGTAGGGNSSDGEQLVSGVGSGNNGDKQELTGTQEFVMDNVEYNKECKNRVTGDSLGNDEGGCKMDPERSPEDGNFSEVESGSNVQNISWAQNISEEEIDEQENRKLSESSSSHEDTLKETDSKDEVSYQNFANDEEDSDDLSGDICTCEDTSEQTEFQVKIEPQVTENITPEQSTLQPEHSTQIPEQSTPLAEEGTSELEKSDHVPEEGTNPVQTSLSEESSLPEEDTIPEQVSLSEDIAEQKPLGGDQSLPEQGTRKEEAMVSDQETEMGDLNEPDSQFQLSGLSGNENPIVGDITSEEGGCEPVPGMSMEPSRLFGAGFFSPAHSRQNSLIVELGEDSMSERMRSIQSDLMDRGETASQMDSCRSLSELSDSEAGEPITKRLKTDVSLI